MSREVHVRFCESRGVRFPSATHLVIMTNGTADDAAVLKELARVVLAGLGLEFSEAQIEKSFRMPKTDLRARPIYHHKRDSIEAHLTVVMAALAVSRIVERSTTWSIARFVKTLRRYRSVTIQAGDQTITAADPLPDDALHALTRLRAAAAAH